MALTSQLERIAGLVEQLGPLAKKQRGMRIEAQEWNALVDVLLGVLKIDRAQEESTLVTLEQRFAARVHEHLGEVGLTWLDADLQSRLGDQQGSVPTRTALAELEKRIQGFGDEVARLTAQAESLHKLIDSARVDAVDRSRTLTQFENRFAGLENLRTLVATLSTDVNGVKGNLDTVLELRKSLSDAQGNPIDVAKLQTELADVRGLRDNLKGVNGDLLRLKDIELKLDEVADAAGVGAAGGLDQRLSDLSSAMEERLSAGFDERTNTLKQSFEEQNAASETRLRNELNSSLEAKTQALDQSLTATIADIDTRIGQSVDGKIATSAEIVRSQADASAKGLIEARLAGIPDQVRATTSEMLASLRADLVGELSNSLGKEIQTRFTALESSLGNRIGEIEGRVTGFADQIPTLVANSVGDARFSLEATLNEQLEAQIKATRTALEQSLASQVQKVVAERIGDLDGKIAASLNERLASLDQTVADSVAAATRDLPEQIGAEVQRHIIDLDLAGQISAANAALGQQLRAERAEALALEQAKRSEAISGSVNQLRGEIGSLRTELNNTIDSRIKAASTNLQDSFSTQLKGLEGRLKVDAFRSALITPITPISPIGPTG